MDKVIFWDFQGTLAHNEYMISKAIYRVLCINEPSSQIDMEALKRLKISGLPWQKPEGNYEHLSGRVQWWIHVEEIFKETYKSLGFSEVKAEKYAKETHSELVKPDGFKLYDDTIDALNYFKLKGWRNIILSNHVPELPEIVASLGLSKYIELTISSANVGFEKPNPKIYEIAKEMAGFPKDMWMIGDSVLSDVNGPEKAGMKAVLVRSNKEEGIKYYTSNLKELKEIIIG